MAVTSKPASTAASILNKGLQLLTQPAAVPPYQQRYYSFSWQNTLLKGYITVGWKKSGTPIRFRMTNCLASYRFVEEAHFWVFIFTRRAIKKSVTEWTVVNASITAAKVWRRAGESFHPIFWSRTFWNGRSKWVLEQLFVYISMFLFVCNFQNKLAWFVALDLYFNTSILHFRVT